MVLVHLRLGYLRLNPFMINVYNTVSQVVAVPVIFAFALYSKLWNTANLVSLAL